MAAEGAVLRRRHSAELKTLVLEHCAAPGASVAKAAMWRGVTASIVQGWRKLARERAGAVMSPPDPTTLRGGHRTRLLDLATYSKVTYR